MEIIPVWAVMAGAITAIVIGCFVAIRFGGTPRTGG